jgi:hypothetical protein
MEETDSMLPKSEPANETMIAKIIKSRVWRKSLQPARRRVSSDEIKIVAKKPRLGVGVIS